MFPLFLVMAGGALGAGARFVVAQAVTARAEAGWPWGTLSVNLIGGLAMGLLVGAVARQGSGDDQIRLLLGVGVLGGFTTFSAFSLDVVILLERGAWLPALGYVAVSVIGSVGALFGGLALVRA